MARSLQEQIAFLQDFSACDVSDALLQLDKPEADGTHKGGFLADIVPYAPSSPMMPLPQSQPKVIAPASTMKLTWKWDTNTLPSDSPNVVPAGCHWADVTKEGTILVIDQPQGQTCAAVGGIMATRMMKRGLKGCVVNGRVRDLAELRASALPMWAVNHSTVGYGGESKVLSIGTKLEINKVTIVPGDLVFCDPIDGIVIIPQDLIDRVIEVMPGRVAGDSKVKEAVEAGSDVQTAIQKYRRQ